VAGGKSAEGIRVKDAKKLAENPKKILTKYISCDIIIVSGGRYKIKAPDRKR
jgi:hypothetical protein